jgi:trehalose 6-phosphate phosphatase
MNNLDERVERSLDELAGLESLLVALDFDGTLAPLRDNPSDSRITAEGVAVLERLAGFGSVHLALVSGRPVGELARLAQVPVGTLLVGSHGAETGAVLADGPHLAAVVLSGPRAEQLERIGRALSARAASLDGAWVENKPAAAVLHTRLVKDRARAAALSEWAEREGRALGGHVLRGKNVVEISVIATGKAGALRRLREETGAEAILFAGDDVTDELALRTLKPPDLGIHVGPGKSAACLSVPDTAALCELLECLADKLQVRVQSAGG